jgi:hypothetical protein
MKFTQLFYRHVADGDHSTLTGASCRGVSELVQQVGEQRLLVVAESGEHLVPG